MMMPTRDWRELHTQPRCGVTHYYSFVRRPMYVSTLARSLWCIFRAACGVSVLFSVCFHFHVPIVFALLVFLLQVFASIQTQVLVKDPYYNEGILSRVFCTRTSM